MLSGSQVNEPRDNSVSCPKASPSQGAGLFTTDSALPAPPMPRSTTASLRKPRPLLAPFLGMQLAVAASRGPWNATVPGVTGAQPFMVVDLGCPVPCSSPPPGQVFLYCTLRVPLCRPPCRIMGRGEASPSGCRFCFLIRQKNSEDQFGGGWAVEGVRTVSPICVPRGTIRALEHQCACLAGSLSQACAFMLGLGWGGGGGGVGTKGPVKGFCFNQASP